MNKRKPKAEEPKKCATCNKPPKDGCSRVECASRKVRSAAPNGDPDYQGHFRAVPVYID